MKTLQRAIQVLACGVGAMAFMASASAEVQPGFYLGAAAGEATYGDFNKSEFDAIVIDAIFSAGAFPLAGGSTFEDSDTSIAIVAGYQFLPYIALEAGFINLGTAEYRWNGNVNPPGPLASAPTNMSIDIESKGFTLTGIGSVPIGDIFELHGRLGFFFADTDLDVDVTIGTGNSGGTENFDSQGVFYGVGAGFNLGQHWSISLDWSRYDNVGDEDEDDDADTEAGFDIDELSLGVKFRF